MEWKKLRIKELEGFIKYNKFGLTHRDISDKLGVSKNTLVYSIRQEAIKLSVFQDLCEILHTNPAVFFNIDNINDINNETSYGGEPMKGKFVPIEVYDEMKQQLLDEIRHLREINLIMANNNKTMERRELTKK